MLEARRFLISACLAFSSVTRFERIWAYSFCCACQRFGSYEERCSVTYGGVLDLLGLAALECDAVTLVLEALRSDEALDARSLGVWLGTLLLGLDLTTDDELADLLTACQHVLWSQTQPARMAGLAKRSRAS